MWEEYVLTSHIRAELPRFTFPREGITVVSMSSSSPWSSSVVVCYRTIHCQPAFSSSLLSPPNGAGWCGYSSASDKTSSKAFASWTVGNFLAIAHWEQRQCELHLQHSKRKQVRDINFDSSAGTKLWPQVSFGNVFLPFWHHFFGLVGFRFSHTYVWMWH